MSHGIGRRAMGAESISPAKLIDGLKNPAYFDQRWLSVPPTASAINGYGAPTGATGDINFAHFRGLVPMTAAYHIKGAGQTLLAPSENNSTGLLDAGLDKAASEGVEYVIGGKQSQYNPWGSVLGAADNRNKFLRLAFQLDDASEVAECALGFRKAEAFQANLDDYDELACLNVQAGTVNIETILNGGTTGVTDTGKTLADDTQMILEVRMKGRKPSYYVNGQEFLTSFQFDNGEIIVPFIFFLQTAGTGSSFGWARLTAGAHEDDDESTQF